MDDTTPRFPAMAAWLAWVGVILLGLTSPGCGYRQDVPSLPAGAKSIAVDTVRNFTNTGELDVRLRALLERKFLRQAHVAIRPPQRSDLLLTVNLTDLKITRVLDPAITTNRTFSFVLIGEMTLTDRRNGEMLIARRRLGASATRLYAPAVRETPAIRDEGLNDVLAAFADQVEREIFLVF